jgi:hypothetical protein
MLVKSSTTKLYPKPFVYSFFSLCQYSQERIEKQKGVYYETRVIGHIQSQNKNPASSSCVWNRMYISLSRAEAPPGFRNMKPKVHCAVLGTVHKESFEGKDCKKSIELTRVYALVRSGSKKHTESRIRFSHAVLL